MFLDKGNKKKAKQIFSKIIDLGIDFKLQDCVTKKQITISKGKKLITRIPKDGIDIDDIIKEFAEDILPYCTNFSSTNFMGFPDSGNSIAGISGAILYNFLQQNLINQSFCGPSATFVEIAVIQWLRELIGYQNQTVKDIWSVGGVITPGGTASNTIGIMLARENYFPGAMQNGVKNLDRAWIMVPKGIGHYSVKSAQMWVGCGHRLIEVETNNFKYDLNDLANKLEQYKNKIMCVVAYAGDSRTMTIDNFREIARIVKLHDKRIWLHADACHGFCLSFSNKLKHKINGIEEFDSITMDPHKVMNIPYAISVLLVKDPKKIKSVASISDLIMQERFAFGQITPFLGSRPWDSLKLWFILKNLGKSGVAKLVERRCELAKFLAEQIKNDPEFILLNDVEINSVLFMYKNKIDPSDINLLNEVNKKIHTLVVREGRYNLHQFSILDSGKIKKGAILYPQRFMSGNPNLTEDDTKRMIEYIRTLGARVVGNSRSRL